MIEQRRERRGARQRSGGAKCAGRWLPGAARLAPRALLPLLLVQCASSTLVPPEWRVVPEAPRVAGLSYDRSGILLYVPPKADAGEFAIETTGGGQRLVRGAAALTPSFRAIESFAVSEERGEIVFSAMRENDFDVALVSTEGGRIHWVPNDRLDEIAVQWAPRGNKISYVVRGPRADFVRTVHVPTATQVTVAFPDARVGALAWDPAGERFAVAVESPDASERVETMKYDGEDRRVAMPPAVRLDAAIESIDGTIVLRPPALRYGETLPLVVWHQDDPLRWDDARAELIRSARVACAVTAGGKGSIPAAPWIDPKRLFHIGGEGRVPGAVSIVADASLPENHYRRRGGDIAVAPAVVKSFAARFMTDRLKGPSPPHGSHR